MKTAVVDLRVVEVLGGVGLRGGGGPSSGYQEPKLEGPRLDSSVISRRVVKVWTC